MDLTSQIWQIASALILIVGLVVVLGLVAKRMQSIRGARGGSLQIVDSTVLGSREKLVLVQVNDKQVLLGINQQCIAKLLEIDAQSGQFSQVLSECTQEQQR